MGFSRQEYWSGLPCPPPGDLSDPGIEPTSLMSPALAGRFFSTGAAPYIALHTRIERLCMTRRMQNQKKKKKENKKYTWVMQMVPLWCALPEAGAGGSRQLRFLSPHSMLPCQNIDPHFPDIPNMSREARNWIFIVKSNFQKVTNANFLVAKCPSLAASCSRALYESGGNLASLACWPQTCVLCLLDSVCPRWLVQWLTVSKVF